MSTASAYSLADQVRAKRKYAEDQGPPKRDPALDVALPKRSRQSIVSKLRCRVGVSGDTERKLLTQDQMRKEGKYPLWLQIHVPEYLFAVLSNFRITENVAYRTPANRVPRGTIFQTSVLRGTQFKRGLYFFSHNFLQ